MKGSVLVNIQEGQISFGSVQQEGWETHANPRFNTKTSIWRFQWVYAPSMLYMCTTTLTKNNSVFLWYKYSNHFWCIVFLVFVLISTQSAKLILCTSTLLRIDRLFQMVNNCVEFTHMLHTSIVLG